MFQNQLRTQERNTTTVNIVVATVDYLLRLQESIRDFYLHHSHHDSIEVPARDAFLAAFKITKQVLRTLTEYIQVRRELAMTSIVCVVHLHRKTSYHTSHEHVQCMTVQ